MGGSRGGCATAVVVVGYRTVSIRLVGIVVWPHLFLLVALAAKDPPLLPCFDLCLCVVPSASFI